MKGLIIDEPWISKVLSGQKTWEMRSRPTSVRGQIALIRKGSGTVVGVAVVSGCRGPLTLDELRVHIDRHQVPMVEFESGRARKWSVAWELSDAKSLVRPISYQHPYGAVVWVNLDAGVEVQVRTQLQDLPVDATAVTSGDTHQVGPRPASYAVDPSCRVPVASDGTWFGPHLLRSGQFTIGDKGSELRLDSYEDALEALSGMQVPRWRRPNKNGNWGIVSGFRWVRAGELGA